MDGNEQKICLEEVGVIGYEVMVDRIRAVKYEMTIMKKMEMVETQIVK